MTTTRSRTRTRARSGTKSTVQAASPVATSSRPQAESPPERSSPTRSSVRSKRRARHAPPSIERHQPPHRRRRRPARHDVHVGTTSDPGPHGQRQGVAPRRRSRRLHLRLDARCTRPQRHPNRLSSRRPPCRPRPRPHRLGQRSRRVGPTSLHPIRRTGAGRRGRPHLDRTGQDSRRLGPVVETGTLCHRTPHHRLGPRPMAQTSRHLVPARPGHVPAHRDHPAHRHDPTGHGVRLRRPHLPPLRQRRRRRRLAELLLPRRAVRPGRRHHPHRPPRRGQRPRRPAPLVRAGTGASRLVARPHPRRVALVRRRSPRGPRHRRDLA